MTAGVEALPVRCPRCGVEFACGAAGPAPCACASVPLGGDLQLRLRSAYTGCLCIACLRELSTAPE